MERLIADANRVKEANGEMADLSIESFADVTEAIHIIQTEMGITGTTAEEADKTISGSFNSMKAAWENLVTGMSDKNADVSDLIQKFVDSVKTFASNLLPVIEQALLGVGTLIEQLLPQIIDRIPQIINQILPQLLESGVNMINSIITGIQQNLSSIVSGAMQIARTLINAILSMLPQILQLGISVIVELAKGLAEQTPTLIPVMIDAIITMVETLLDNIDLLIDAGIQLIMALADGLIESLPNLIDKIPTIIDKLIMAITNNLPKLIEMGIVLIVKLAEGLIKAIPQLVSKIPQIISSLVNGVKNYFSNMLSLGGELLGKVKDGIVNGISGLLDVGKNIVKGLWNGINNAKDWILDKIKGFGKSILNGLKSFFGIHSPSTLMRDMIGKNLVLGVGVSFEKDGDLIDNQIKDFGDDVVDKMQRAVNVETGKMSFSGTAGSVSEILNANATFEGTQNTNLFLDGEKVYENQQKISARKNLQYGGVK